MIRMTILLSLAAVLTACLSTSDSNRQAQSGLSPDAGDDGDLSGLDPDAGGGGDIQAPYPNQTCDGAAEGEALAGDWWSGDCSCGWTWVCQRGEWLDAGSGCWGSCAGYDPEEARAIDWEAEADGGQADAGRDDVLAE